jgi:hypothetical protein
MLAVFSIPHSVSMKDITGSARPIPAVTVAPAAAVEEPTTAGAAATAATAGAAVPAPTP